MENVPTRTLLYFFGSPDFSTSTLTLHYDLLSSTLLLVKNFWKRFRATRRRDREIALFGNAVDFHPIHLYLNPYVGDLCNNVVCLGRNGDNVSRGEHSSNSPEYFLEGINLNLQPHRYCCKARTLI